MRRLRLFVGLVALSAACAHADSFEGGVLHKGDVSVKLGAVPPTWRRIHVEGADLAFRDDAHEGSALVDVRCGRRDEDAPLSVLTEHLIMGTTDRQIDSEETVPFDGREALHTLLRAKLDGVPMQYDIYVIKKDGCVYDLVYVAPPVPFAQGAREFDRFAHDVRQMSSPRIVGSDRAATSASDP